MPYSIRTSLFASVWLGIVFAIALTSVEAKKKATYDYIIVGSGAGGGTLATRLSQGLPHASILLIEAGPSGVGEPKIDIPALRGSTIGGPFDWNFTTVPQTSAADRVISLPRGKVLGGSTALNFMLWNRASEAEFDAWEELGNPGWDWASVSDGMIKSENFTNLNLTEAGFDERGFVGPIHTTISRYIPERQHLWRDAMENLGVPKNIDSLSGHPLGVSFQPGSIDTVEWKRSYIPSAYLPQAGDNLDVLLNTRVVRVNLGKCGKGNLSATGITLEDGTIVNARQEVILSAGALQSPGLLELSGIGREDVLRAAGIERLIDLPGVGENLQDHVRVQLVWELGQGYTGLDELIYNSTFSNEQLALWENGEYSIYDELPNGISLLNYKQAFGDDGAARLLAYAQEQYGNSSNVIDQKKLQLLADDSVAKVEVIYIDGYLGAGTYPEPGSANYGKNYASLVLALMHSLSLGSVHITSSNISVAPALDPKYLVSDHDVQALISLGKLGRKIASTDPFASILNGEYEPGLQAVQSDEDWLKFVNDTSLSFFHTSSTCAMLPREKGGVVDPELKVWGTKNLRVVDASIFPVLIASHTQSATYGVAERAAEIIIAAAI